MHGLVKPGQGGAGTCTPPALPPCSCPVPTTETKSPKSTQACNSPICLLEQQLSPRSKLPKLLNVQLQLPALASALVTLLQFLAKPGTSVFIDAGFPPCQAPVPPPPALPTQPHSVCLTSPCAATEIILRSSLDKTFPSYFMHSNWKERKLYLSSKQ